MDETVEQYYVLLENSRLGPYPRRTVVGMCIKGALAPDSVLQTASGQCLRLSELVVARKADSGRPSSQPASMYPRFKVRFCGPGKGNFGFSGEGEVRVQADLVRIAGTRPQLLGKPEEGRVKVNFSVVRDVQLDGEEVSFALSDRAPFDKKLLAMRVRLAADTAELAAELHALIAGAVDAGKPRLVNLPPIV